MIKMFSGLRKSATRRKAKRALKNEIRYRLERMLERDNWKRDKQDHYIFRRHGYIAFIRTLGEGDAMNAVLIVEKEVKK